MLKKTFTEPQKPQKIASGSKAPLRPRQDIRSSTRLSTVGQPRSISTILGGTSQVDAPKKLDQTMPESGTVTLGDTSNRRLTGHQKLSLHLPLNPINTEDLKEFLQSLGMDHVEGLASTVHDESLTEAQIDAFRAVFERFDKNTEGCVDAEALSSSLDSMGIAISPEEVHTAIKRADYDEDGMVGFHDFLSMMTDSQQFSKCVEAEGAERVDVSEKVFYKTLTKMLNAEALPSRAPREIVHYYHKKMLHLIRKTMHLDEGGGHVLAYYTKGAHLLGLSCKQLMKYMKPWGEKSSQKESPYLYQPNPRADHAHMHMSLNHAMLKRMSRIKTTKTWKTVEIEERVRQLSIKHPGMETKEMITPVKIKVILALKERDHLTFNQIKQIVSKSQSGLNLYLKTLSQYKRRDSWNSWGSLQKYCLLHRCKHFAQTFSTYSWSWSAGRNMLEEVELLQSKGSTTQILQGFPPMRNRASSCAKEQMEKDAEPKVEQKTYTSLTCESQSNSQHLGAAESRSPSSYTQRQTFKPL